MVAGVHDVFQASLYTVCEGIALWYPYPARVGDVAFERNGHIQLLFNAFEGPPPDPTGVTASIPVATPAATTRRGRRVSRPSPALEHRVLPSSSPTRGSATPRSASSSSPRSSLSLSGSPPLGALRRHPSLRGMLHRHHPVGPPPLPLATDALEVQKHEMSYAPRFSRDVTWFKAAPGASVPVHGVPVGGTLGFTVGRDNGAIMILRNPVERELSLAQGTVRSYLSQHIGWIMARFGATFDLRESDVFMVTTVERTSDWAFSVHHKAEQAFEVTCSVAAALNSGFWGHWGGATANSKQGPPRAEGELPTDKPGQRTSSLLAGHQPSAAPPPVPSKPPRPLRKWTSLHSKGPRDRPVLPPPVPPKDGANVASHEISLGPKTPGIVNPPPNTLWGWAPAPVTPSSAGVHFVPTPQLVSVPTSAPPGITPSQTMGQTGFEWGAQAQIGFSGTGPSGTYEVGVGASYQSPGDTGSSASLTSSVQPCQQPGLAIPLGQAVITPLQPGDAANQDALLSNWFSMHPPAPHVARDQGVVIRRQSIARPFLFLAGSADDGRPNLPRGPGNFDWPPHLPPRPSTANGQSQAPLIDETSGKSSDPLRLLHKVLHWRARSCDCTLASDELAAQLLRQAPANGSFEERFWASAAQWLDIVKEDGVVHGRLRTTARPWLGPAPRIARSHDIDSPPPTRTQDTAESSPRPSSAACPHAAVPRAVHDVRFGIPTILRAASPSPSSSPGSHALSRSPPVA